MGGRRDLKSVPYHLREDDPDLYNFLIGLADSESDGVPGGVTATTPSTVQAGDTANIGTESLGWSPGDHEHAVETGTAVGLANANAEGSGTPLARASHTHKRDVRVALGGSDVGTRNRLNFVDSSQIDFQITDDSGNDEVDITAIVIDDSITNAKLANVPGFTVKGKSDTGTGDPTDILAGTDTVLGRIGSGNLIFAQVATDQIANNAVTDAKLRQGSARSVIGRAAATVGNVADIVAANDAEFLSRHSGTLAFAAIDYSDLPPSSQHWTRTGAIVHLTAAGDEVSIGDTDQIDNTLYKLEVLNAAALKRYSAVAGEPATLGAYRARGSFGSLSAIGANDNILDINAWGSGSSGFVLGGQIRFVADGTFDSASAQAPTRIDFLVEDGSGAGPVVRMRIDDSGVVQVGRLSGIGSPLGVLEGTSDVTVATAGVSAKSAFDDDQAREALAISRLRPDGTAPGAGFAADIGWWLQGADDTMVNAAIVRGLWEGSQSNDTTARDSALAFRTMLNNALAEAGRFDSNQSLLLGGTTSNASYRLIITGDTRSAGDIDPEADGTRDLGSSSLRWNDVWTERLLAGIVTGITGSGLLNSASLAAAVHYFGEHADDTAANNVTQRFVRSRGSLASKTQVATNDLVADFDFQARGASALEQMALYRVFVESGTNRPGGAHAFYTLPDLSMGAVLTLRMMIGHGGNVIIGSQAAALATTATQGFLHVPSCAGTPTGVPTLYTGSIPIVYDSTNFILYAYAGGAWRAH